MILLAGKKLGVFVFDDLSSQVAFCGIDRNEEEEENFSIFYFKIGTQKPIKISNNVKNINRDNLLISKDFLRFSENGQYVFFNKKRKATILKGNLIQGVDVWSYNDKYLQSEQGSNMYSGDAKSQFKCVLNLQNFGVTQLEDEQTSVQLKANNRFVLAFRIPMYYDYYDNHDTASLFLISLSDGKRTVLAKGQGNFDATLSPKENSVVWFDLDSLAYFAYDIISGHTRNISNDIPFPTYDPEAKKIGRSTPFGLPFTALSSRWVDDNRSILIYDQYDIWMVDLQGIKQAINITNGFGRKNEIAFGIVDRDLSNHELAISDKSEILLAGFEIATKRNGFWSARIGKSKNPILKSMQDYTYYVPRTGNGYQIDVFQSYGVYPQKAKNADRWLVQRMNSAVSANLFLTSDFQHFQPLSDIKPEKNYVWLTSELVSWTQSNGQILHGILYKPDNFDSSKRYPLIFNYYARRSNELNEFIKPDFSRHNINIPFFVSNGYLVFVPDIYYQSGHNGVGVMNSIVSARNNLIKLPWIDSMKIGLDGHSFGGWETNFIITHCNLFAAASEAAGVSDQISAYGQLNFGTGQQRQEFYETWSQGSSYGVGVTPWTRTDLYLENSPITKIDKVVTPLLMMHCKNDLSVPFEQAIEMFLGMRRAGKKVWLLQYDNDGHVLYNDENAKDYTIRLLQFFDYYLKGCPAPVWMTKGVPMSSKGKNKGFEYDTSRDVP
jgi:dipeptidyl aminopeptidase/acylaminoacyl peptidase